MRETIALTVSDPSQVGEARRAAAALCTRLGLAAEAAGAIAIVVTEAATNVYKHASSGYVLLRPLESNTLAGVEVLALDKGPGMASVAACLRDGYSTIGTPGTGLGAIQRLSQEFDIYSAPGVGTALMARIWSGAFNGQAATSFGMVCVPKPREEVCGDSWSVTLQQDRGVFMVVDGLGHGPEAAQASAEAVRVAHGKDHAGPVELMENIHAALRGTRGAAAAVADVSWSKQEVRYAGIGNIAGALLCVGQRVRHMVSGNGIVGHQARKIAEFCYPHPRGTIMVLHSDGLASQWSVDPYPGLLGRHPALLAGVLYRDFVRGTDDVTVMAARQPAS